MHCLYVLAQYSVCWSHKSTVCAGHTRVQCVLVTQEYSVCWSHKSTVCAGHTREGVMLGNRTVPCL